MNNRTLHDKQQYVTSGVRPQTIPLAFSDKGINQFLYVLRNERGHRNPASEHEFPLCCKNLTQFPFLPTEHFKGIHIFLCTYLSQRA